MAKVRPRGITKVPNGGTGAGTAAGARTNLSAAQLGANSDITSLSGLTTPLSVAQGGTGLGTLTSGSVLVGAGTSAVTFTLLKSPIIGCHGQVAQSLTRYVSLSNNSGGAGIQTNDPSAGASNLASKASLMSVAGTIKNLYINVDAAPAAGQTFTYTLMKNGSAQTLTATVTDAGKTASDTSNSFTVAAGDLVSMRIVTSATSGNCDGSFSVEFDATP